MYVASWSGGKDGCLACYEAIRSGYDVRCLVNFISGRHQRVRFHGTPKNLLDAQSQAVGIRLIQRATADDDYEAVFKETLRGLLPEGLEGMVFGDIHLEEHREWGRRVCAEVGIEAVHPLFGRSSADVLQEFLASGFEAVIISGQPSFFSGEQMGQRLDQRFAPWCGRAEGLDVCGENGEYHTIVLDGPLFWRRLRLTESEPVQVDGHWFLDIRGWELVEKPGGKIAPASGAVVP
jgi:diphthine-ammonia ligase